MNKKIKVVQYGLGPIGCRSVQYLTERGHFDLVGAIDSDERKVGIDVGELAELPKALGLHVTDDSTNLLKKVDAEVVVLATTSSLEQIRPQVLEIISCGKNVAAPAWPKRLIWLPESKGSPFCPQG
jgi:4-hydroxy-tetrahydrodipicolinate reductase